MHFRCFFMVLDKAPSSLFLLHMDIEFSQSYLLKRSTFLPLNCVGTFVRVFLFFSWNLNPISLMIMSILMPLSHCLDYCTIIVLKSGSVNLPTCFFLSTIVLTFLSSFHFYIDFMISLSISLIKILLGF